MKKMFSGSEIVNRKYLNRKITLIQKSIKKLIRNNRKQQKILRDHVYNRKYYMKHRAMTVKEKIVYHKVMQDFYKTRKYLKGLYSTLPQHRANDGKFFFRCTVNELKKIRNFINKDFGRGFPKLHKGKSFVFLNKAEIVKLRQILSNAHLKFNQ